MTSKTNPDTPAPVGTSHLARETFPSGKIRCNASVVWDRTTRKAVLFDPTDDPDEILERIAELGLSVERILLTHGHVDHATRAEETSDRLGVPYLMHPDDLPVWKRIPSTAALYGIKAPAFVRAPEPLHDLQEFVTPFLVRTLHVPGHTRGSVAFHIPDADLLIAGDTLFQGSVGRTDLPESAPELLEGSIRERLYVLPEETVVVAGHGPDTTIGYERRHNPYVPG